MAPYIQCLLGPAVTMAFSKRRVHTVTVLYKYFTQANDSDSSKNIARLETSVKKNKNVRNTLSRTPRSHLNVLKHPLISYFTRLICT